MGPSLLEAPGSSTMDQETKPEATANTTTSLPASSSPPASFSSLPPELHLLISQQLTYPDALSLKHTNRILYDLVYTGINLKIEWLIERRRLHLDCPHDRRCELGSDLKFCRGSVRLLMKRRREHGECDTHSGGRGCLVFGTAVCTLRKHEPILKKLMRWVRDHVAVLRWKIEHGYAPLLWAKVEAVLLVVLVTGLGVLLGVLLGRR